MSHSVALVDQDDNDPARFWAYVIAALQRALPRLALTTITTLLEAPQPPPSQAVLIELLNELSFMARAHFLKLL